MLLLNDENLLYFAVINLPRRTLEGQLVLLVAVAVMMSWTLKMMCLMMMTVADSPSIVLIMICS